jgi:hypothetical protein
MTVAGDWPRTNRALPWLLALFLVVMWLVPSQAISLPLPLPMDPFLDRILLLAIAALTILSIFTKRELAPGRPAPGLSRVMLFFFVISLVSVLLNAETLAGVGEIEQATKKLVVLVGYIALFYLVATIIRPSELRNFARLIVVLAVIAAIGTIYEYRTDINYFYDTARSLFGGFAEVAEVPGESDDGRPETVGPTQHGLAITTMLAFALPFAVLGLLSAKTGARKALYFVAVAVLLAGGLATLRKTSLIAPLTALLVIIAYRPRQMLRLAPLGVVLVLAIHAMAPEALGGVGKQLTNNFFNSGTTVGRTSDYEQVKPEVATYPLTGRGYGSITPERSDTYRILDNQYLGQLVQVGYVGLAAYVLLILAAFALAHAVIKRAPTPDRRDLGVAAAAGFATFGVGSALFDILSFWQSPSMFFFIAGLCSVAASKPAPAYAPAFQPAHAT